MINKIAIIGGGYTGLTAAYRLSKSGHNVTLYEKSSTLGGLAGGFEISGFPIEKTYHHLFKTDRHIISLAHELGIGDRLKFYDSSMSIYLEDKLLPFTSALDLLKFNPLSFINRIRAGLVVLYLQKIKYWKKYENISAIEWMTKYAGMEVTNKIWLPLLKGKFHSSFNKISMAWLWARINVRARSRNKLGKEQLGYFDDGFQTFTDALVAKLKANNVKIVLNADVQEVSEIGSQIFITVNSKKVYFDKVIATVPSHIFSKLIEASQIDQAYHEKLNSINYLVAVVMVFSSDQKISDYYWHNINESESPFQVFLNHTALVGNENYGGKNIYYLGKYLPHDHEYFEMTDEEISNLWLLYLNRIFPNFNAVKIEEKYIFKFKNAQHVVDRDYQTKIPDYRTPIEGVYLANFSQIYPEDRGTNFAVREGERIAEMIERDLSI